MRRLPQNSLLLFLLACAFAVSALAIPAAAQDATDNPLSADGLPPSSFSTESYFPSSYSIAPIEPERKNVIAAYPTRAGRIKARGIEVHGFLKTELSTDFHSGFTSDGTDARSLVETSLSIDLSKTVSWKGARLNASFHDYFGSNATDELVGDVQGFSNIDARSNNRIYELWFEQTLAHGKVRLKMGRIDANTEFAYVENAADFLNSSMGFSPTILGFDTYPDLRTGGLIALRPWRSVSVTVGDFRCPERGNMALGEIGTQGRTFKKLPGRIAVGSWVHPHMREDYMGRLAFGINGMYAIVEQTLWKPHSEIPDDSRGIRGFAQWGEADPAFSAVSRHQGGGLAWTGIGSRRPSDSIGLAVTQVHVGAAFYGDEVSGREHSIETFYKIALRKWWSVTADMQWIGNSSHAAQASQPYAATVRVAISY
jgi:porin